MPNVNTGSKSDIKFVRNRKYGTIGVASNGWTKEVCNVTWNDKNPKLDIREWDNEYAKMSKGLTFSKEEARKLLRILASIDFEEFDSFSIINFQQNSYGKQPQINYSRECSQNSSLNSQCNNMPNCDNNSDIESEEEINGHKAENENVKNDKEGSFETSVPYEFNRAEADESED